MSDLLTSLNAHQQEAVTHVNGPLLIVAGAGTGKTTVLTHRVAWLIQEGLAKPEEILVLTFTEKAATELEERVDRLVPYGHTESVIGTFHAFAEQMLREYGILIGISPTFKTVSEIDAWLIARRAFDTFSLDLFRPLGNPTKYLKSLLTHVSLAKDAGIDAVAYKAFAESHSIRLMPSDETPESWEMQGKRLQELAHVYTTYQALLARQDALDFGDLLLGLRRLLSTPDVRQRLRTRFRFVLVDEFQDTNEVQYDILRQLCDVTGNITVVGDDDQAIYRFRGATVKNILSFEQDFPTARRVVLTDNYRSSQQILDTAHALIQGNNPFRLESSRTDLSKRLSARLLIDGNVEHLCAADLHQEAELVVDKILALKAVHTDMAWSDVAILARSNAHAEPFLQALERRGLPFVFMAMKGLYAKPIILDLVAYLRLLIEPSHSASLYRLLTHEAIGVSQRDVVLLLQVARKKGWTLVEALARRSVVKGLSDAAQTRLTWFEGQVRTHRELSGHKRLSELFVRVNREAGFLEHVQKLPEAEEVNACAHLDQFLDRIKRFEAQHDHPTLKHFLEEYEQERESGEEGGMPPDLTTGPDTIKVMTVHAAKGLEFRFVFIVSLIEGRFPTTERAVSLPLPVGLKPEEEDDGEHLREERRLFYVALTRGKERVFCTSAADYGGKRTRKPSRFLKEIGLEEGTRVEGRDQLLEIPVALIDETEVVLPLPKDVSFTQLAAFRTCPKQYKFAHILKIPVLGKWTMSFGKTMHNTLHRVGLLLIERTSPTQASLFTSPSPLTEGGPLIRREEVAMLFEQAWIDEWYVNQEQRERYRTQGRESLERYIDEMNAHPPTVLFVERGFTLHIGEVVLKGRIDRIDAYEDGVEIIDYKTGTPKKKLEREDKEQLYLYQIAVKEVFGLTPKKLTYLYLEDGSSLSFLGKDDDLIDLKETVQERVQEIKQSRFVATPGLACRFCDFAEICEEREY